MTHTHGPDCPMICRTVRVLPDGCVGCGYSTTACAAMRDHERRACCETCNHPNT